MLLEMLGKRWWVECTGDKCLIGGGAQTVAVVSLYAISIIVISPTQQKIHCPLD